MPLQCHKCGQTHVSTFYCGDVRDKKEKKKSKNLSFIMQIKALRLANWELLTMLELLASDPSLTERARAIIAKHKGG